MDINDIYQGSSLNSNNIDNRGGFLDNKVRGVNLGSQWQLCREKFADYVIDTKEMFT